MSDKRVLLVTTGISKVRLQLEDLCGRCLHVVDWSDMQRCDLFQYLRSMPYDILITYRCPYILPLDIIDKSTVSAFNIHPSLLPAYPGLNPWEEMVRNNERVGGVSFHVLTEKVDQGKIMKSESFDLDFSLGLAYNRNKADELAGAMIRSVLAEMMAPEVQLK